MFRKIMCFLFLFSLASAEFIDFAETDYLPRMREYAQQDPDYYIQEDVRYNMEMDLSIPSSQSYRWLSGSGSYSDIHDGDSVCEGSFNYQVRVNARALENDDFEGFAHTYIAPGTWPACSGSCPGGDTYVYWGNSCYNAHYQATVESSSMQLDNSPCGATYSRRPMAYRVFEDSAWTYNKRADVATVMKGTSKVRYAATGGYSIMNTLYNFGALSGNTPSHSGTLTLSSSSHTEYAFTQDLDVSGAMIGYYMTDVAHVEHYRAFTSLGTSGQSQYSEDFSATSEVNVYDEDHVGIIDPYILMIDLDTYEVEPGDSIPATITMYIPARPSNYYALPFEFYNVNVGGSSGATFTEVSGINQCGGLFPHRNGGWFGNSAYTSDIEGTLHIPSTLGPGTHSLPFTVAWRSCSGAEDCDGNGITEITPQITIEVEIPDDSPDPDLTCTVVPTAYVNGTLPGPDGFVLGEGVESWEVTVTNNGPGNATVDTIQMQACSILVFNAYDSDLAEAFDPFWWAALVSTAPEQIDSGESVSWDINAEALCRETGDDVFALAWLNLASLWYPSCTPYMIEETNYYNNICGWSAPCEGAPPEVTGCEITPTHVGDPGPNTNHSFALTCSGLPCTGIVTWDTTGDPIGSITSSGQTGADVQVIDYELESDYSGAMMLHATVATPDNMICNATIDIDVEGTGGDGDYGCELHPQTQVGYAGSYHRFYITCSDSEDPGDDSCDGGVYWHISEGTEYVTPDSPIGTSEYGDVTITPSLFLTEEGELVRLVATWNEITCDGEILLPLEDCLDFI